MVNERPFGKYVNMWVGFACRTIATGRHMCGGHLIALKYTLVIGFRMTELNIYGVKIKTAYGDYIKNGLRFLPGLIVLSSCT